MKREILCPPCAMQFAADVVQSLLPTRFVEVVEADECVRMEVGDLLLAVRCDHCNRPLAAGAAAWCASLWSETVGRPYVRWESDYIAPRPA